MSTSKVIPKDKTGSIQRWKCPDVNVKNGSGKGSSAVGPVTAETIERIQRQAYKEAYDDGLKNGYKEGMEKAQATIDGQLRLLGNSLQTLSQPFKELDQDVEQQVVHLAVIIARQLVRREIKTDPGQVIAIVREAVLALPAATRKIYVNLHPEDVALVKDKLISSDKDTYWQLLDDPTLNRGDCRVRTESSSIDATMERRLSSIVTNMLGGEREQDQEQDNDDE